MASSLDGTAGSESGQMSGQAPNPAGPQPSMQLPGRLASNRGVHQMKSCLSASPSTESGGESGTESNGLEKPLSHMHTYSTQPLPGLGNNPMAMSLVQDLLKRRRVEPAVEKMMHLTICSRWKMTGRPAQQITRGW